MSTGSEPVVIIGAGGHGREAHDIAIETGTEVLGFVDDGVPVGTPVRDTSLVVLGNLAWLADHPVDHVLAVAATDVRRRLAAALASTDSTPRTLIHPGAGIGSSVDVGPGAIVPQGARLSIGSSLGQHVHLGVSANIAHGCRLGDFVTVTPGVLLSGDCMVGDGVWLGAGAVVNQGLTIGAGATVGSGAVVVADVESGSTVVGVPARRLDRNA